MGQRQADAAPSGHSGHGKESLFYSSTMRSRSRSKLEKSIHSLGQLCGQRFGERQAWEGGSMRSPQGPEEGYGTGQTWAQFPTLPFPKTCLAPRLAPSTPQGQHGGLGGLWKPRLLPGLGLRYPRLGFFTHSVRGTKPSPSVSEENPGLRWSSWLMESESTGSKRLTCSHQRRAVASYKTCASTPSSVKWGS